MNKQIIFTDHFLSYLPHESKLIYLYFSANTDENDYVQNPKAILTLLHQDTDKDSWKILVIEGYLIIAEEQAIIRVIVVRNEKERKVVGTFKDLLDKHYPIGDWIGI